MDNDTISILSSPGKLRRLLSEKPINKGSAIVSEVHRTASYARYLSTKGSNSIAIGLTTSCRRERGHCRRAFELDTQRLLSKFQVEDE
jgi:hypothetical protein